MRISNDPNAKYNVMSVTNIVTGEVYVGARMKDEQDFRRRVNKAARDGVEQTALVKSVRRYGDRKHVYKMLAEDLSFAAAQKLKAELHAKAAVKGKSLMHQLLRGRNMPLSGEYLEPCASVPLKKAVKAKAKVAAEATA